MQIIRFVLEYLHFFQILPNMNVYEKVIVFLIDTSYIYYIIQNMHRGNGCVNTSFYNFMWCRRQFIEQWEVDILAKIH